MNIIAQGQEVHLWCGIIGRVIAVMIEGDAVSYKIAYPSGSEVKFEWFPELLLEHDPKRVEIGFNGSAKVMVEKS